MRMEASVLSLAYEPEEGVRLLDFTPFTGGVALLLADEHGYRLSALVNGETWPSIPVEHPDDDEVEVEVDVDVVEESTSSRTHTKRRTCFRNTRISSLG